jgi:hypothetical protein
MESIWKELEDKTELWRIKEKFGDLNVFNIKVEDISERIDNDRSPAGISERK